MLSRGTGMDSGSRVWTTGDTARWMVLLGVAAIDMAWLAASGKSVDADSLIWRLKWNAVLALFAIVLAAALPGTVSRRFPRAQKLAVRLHAPELVVTSLSIVWIALFACAMSVLSYLLVGLAPPLIDVRLAAVDRALGLDWPAVHAWVRARPVLTDVLQWFYSAGRAQLMLVAFFTGIAGRYTHLREYLCMLCVSLTLVFLVSTPFPAAGAFHYYAAAGASISPAELSGYSHFFLLRADELKDFSLDTMQGLVSMPSFHTAMGLIFIQGMRWSRLGLAVAVPFNLVMIVATPTQGGHHFADVLGGIALWLVSAALVQRLARKRSSAVSVSLVPQGI
ncbi:hypothetical protein N234_03695 [Ralstonia pickettii DTP0602]|nr:hypothetical protein N234_03695 [Ralstonia pickettii DTP0602]